MPPSPCLTKEGPVKLQGLSRMLFNSLCHFDHILSRSKGLIGLFLCSAGSMYYHVFSLLLTSQILLRLVASQARQVASSRGLTLHYWSLPDGLTCCLLGWYGRSSWSVIASQLETLSVKRALSLSWSRPCEGAGGLPATGTASCLGIVGGEPRGERWLLWPLYLWACPAHSYWASEATGTTALIAQKDRTVKSFGVSSFQ